VREGTDWLPGLSFAALDEGEHIAGTIQCWPVALTDPDGRAHPMIMVGPVAVLPGLQGKGYGKALVTASLTAIDPRAPLPQVMIGDLDYYGRFFGFSAREHRWVEAARAVGPGAPALPHRQSRRPARRGHARPLARLISICASADEYLTNHPQTLPHSR
jgi:predicted N-acetyltransferase YhbS